MGSYLCGKLQGRFPLLQSGNPLYEKERRRQDRQYGFPGRENRTAIADALLRDKSCGDPFTKGLALELAPFNILVNSVCPGSVMTDMTVKESEWAAQITGEAPQDILKKWESAIPLKRYVGPEDIANVAVFLASEYSSYMTGQAINVSGGQEMH
jgi:hypothetical protein